MGTAVAWHAHVQRATPYVRSPYVASMPRNHPQIAHWLSHLDFAQTHPWTLFGLISVSINGDKVRVRNIYGGEGELGKSKTVVRLSSTPVGDDEQFELAGTGLVVGEPELECEDLQVRNTSEETRKSRRSVTIRVDPWTFGGRPAAQICLKKAGGVAHTPIHLSCRDVGYHSATKHA